MELRHLRGFMAVAEELHFARAAERLHIEQSPLPRTIKELESDLGAQLFERNSRGTRLTRPGEALAESVQRIFHAVEQARCNVKAAVEPRRTRLLEMAEAMDLFCQGLDGELFNRPGTPWPEADITIVDLATFAREGYNAQLSIAYLSLLNAVSNIAEPDQFLGRPIINVTEEGHIITKNPLLSPYVVKITKMWRKLGAWFWLATQNLDNLPKAAEPMLNMTEWWICLSMPPDEVEKIARFRELSPAQKTLMMSARKEAGKYCEGVVLSKSMEALFHAVPPSLYLAMAMTEPEEKAARFKLMQEQGISELDAAIHIAEGIDRTRGIDPLRFKKRRLAHHCCNTLSGARGHVESTDHPPASPCPHHAATPQSR